MHSLPFFLRLVFYRKMVIASTFFFLKLCSNECFKSLFIRAQLSNVRDFIILRSVEGLNSCHKNNRANVSCEKKRTVKLSEVSFFENKRKKS